MRLPLMLLSLAAVLASSAPARAQNPVSPYVISDSSRFLPRWLEAQAGIGLGWMHAPRNERARYGPGVFASVALEARSRRGVAARIRGSYQDLPPTAPDFLLDAGVPVEYESFVGHGNVFDLSLEGAFAPRRGVWFGAGGGVAHYTANSAASYLDGSGLEFTPYAGSAWSAQWVGSLRFEFQPSPAAPLYAEVRATGQARAPRLGFVGLAIGLRVP